MKLSSSNCSLRTFLQWAACLCLSVGRNSECEISGSESRRRETSSNKCVHYWLSSFVKPYKVALSLSTGPAYMFRNPAGASWYTRNSEPK